MASSNCTICIIFNNSIYKILYVKHFIGIPIQYNNIIILFVLYITTNSSNIIQVMKRVDHHSHSRTLQLQYSFQSELYFDISLLTINLFHSMIKFIYAMCIREGAVPNNAKQNLQLCVFESLFLHIFIYKKYVSRYTDLFALNIWTDFKFDLHIVCNLIQLER